MVARGLCTSRAEAQRAILAGQAAVNGQRAGKASDWVGPDDRVELRNRPKYVSRGGFKLEHALTAFGVTVRGARALDVGASTGGFTDCLLQAGAARVAAVDVGRGQLAWTLRQDPRVEVLEGVNAREMKAAVFAQPWKPFDLATADCSFISLRLILPTTAALVRPGGLVLALVKPQFEAGRQEASRGRGVIRDPEVHRRVLDDLKDFIATPSLGLEWTGVTESPLTGPAGNKEFLACLKKLEAQPQDGF